jgi:ribosomal protein S27E
MAEVTALGTRTCPDCGGAMEWNAAKQAVACPFCGFIPKEQPALGEPANALVEELDLESALAGVPDSGRGFGTPTTSVKCQNCQAISVFERGRVAQRCEFCGSPSIVPYEQTKDPITPRSLLPVKLDQGAVRDLLKQWYASRWFAPNKLKGKALTDTLHAIYLPYWTFDARVHADWTAESGDYYYVTVSGGRDSQGRQTTRQERRVRWYPSSGSLDHFFDDDLIAGTAGVRMDLLHKVEPFPTKEVVPYDASFVRGWTVERYQIDLRQASAASMERMQEATRAMCAQQVPGDTHRNLRVDAVFGARTFKHILVPVWLTTYTFGAKTFHTIVNGYTGAIAGDRPVSWVKVFFCVILPIMIAIIVFVAVRSQQ